MSQRRPAEVRYYVDADILGTAKVLAALRADTTYPGDPGAVIRKVERPACPVTSPAEKDTVWIPIVAKLGWVIITRDSRIQSHRKEINEVRDNKARMVALSGKEARATWEQLEIICCQWRRIEQIFDEPGPCIYTATRTSFVQVSLA